MTRAHPILAPRRRRVDPLPASIEPMLAVSAGLPPDPQNWGFEFKWDGVRCMATWEGRHLTLLSRNHILITQRYPELAGLGISIGKHGCILDGEIVALDAGGKPSFPLLQRRMHVDHPSPALVREVPVWYVLFDVLYADGKSLLDLPYVDRRARLEEMNLAGPFWQTPAFHVGAGAAMVKAAQANAMEGVVAKRLDSPYLPGKRSPLWLKIKVVFGQEFVIGGWIPEAGDREDRVGALLLGYHDGAALRYAGRVGSGFSDSTHARLITALRPLRSPHNPFADPIPKGATFVKPKLVAEVEYRRWPEGGLIHQASFKGLRSDKSAEHVIKETKS